MAAPMARTARSLLSLWTGPCRCFSRVSCQFDRSLASQFRAAYQANQTGSDRKYLCRTAENDPAKHGAAHHGLFYTVPPEEAQRWLVRGNTPEYYALAKAFTETTLMVRDPALEMMQFLGNASYKLPAIRYVLYGRQGSGKTCTLAHLLHYCGRQKWLLMHVPWGAKWIRYHHEVHPSSFKQGRFDQPTEGADWLSYFRTMNLPLLKELNLKTKHRYVWNRRESAEEGTPLLEAIEFGLARPKYSCDIVGLIIKEVRHQATEGRFRALFAVDGVNALWTETKSRREEDITKRIHADELTIVHNFKKLLRNDWSGGAVVCTVDINAGDLSAQESYMPRYLLGKEGFEYFDPYIPIHVPHYSDKEIHSCLDYYTEQRWITHPEGHTDAARQEMIFLSGRNPHELYVVSQMW